MGFGSLKKDQLKCWDNAEEKFRNPDMTNELELERSFYSWAFTILKNHQIMMDNFKSFGKTLKINVAETGKKLGYPQPAIDKILSYITVDNEQYPPKTLFGNGDEYQPKNEKSVNCFENQIIFYSKVAYSRLNDLSIHLKSGIGPNSTFTELGVDEREKEITHGVILAVNFLYSTGLSQPLKALYKKTKKDMSLEDLTFSCNLYPQAITKLGNHKDFHASYISGIDQASLPDANAYADLIEPDPMHEKPEEEKKAEEIKAQFTDADIPF